MNCNKLLAILINYHHNFRILHWKVTGCHFDEYHELCANYYETLQEHVDLIAEIGIIYNEQPLGLVEAFELLKKDSDNYKIIDPKDNYDEEDIIENIDIMFKDIMKAIESLLEESKIDKNLGARSKLEGMYEFYDTECNYKNKRRKK